MNRLTRSAPPHVSPSFVCLSILFFIGCVQSDSLLIKHTTSFPLSLDAILRVIGVKGKKKQQQRQQHLEIENFTHTNQTENNKEKKTSINRLSWGWTDLQGGDKWWYPSKCVCMRNHDIIHFYLRAILRVDKNSIYFPVILGSLDKLPRKVVNQIRYKLHAFNIVAYI